MNSDLTLLSHDEASLRIDKVRTTMRADGVSALLISDNANKYYLTGRVYAGYAYIPLAGEPIYFVKRPVALDGDGVVYFRRLEEIAATIGLNVPETIGLELDTLPWSMAERLRSLFPESGLKNASTLMRRVRAVKTPREIEMIAESGVRHSAVYSHIPSLYVEGMSDHELQVEIERTSRLAGCLGQFRISGDSMELYMGNVLAGENADAPSPYDFAMGGAGLDPSLPVGASGDIIRPGNTVMVDMNGNYNGYMTDMTRVFSLGHIPEKALEAHRCSIDIHRELCSMMRPGVEAKALWEKAEKMVTDRGLNTWYMGHRQHAGFIGHGLGIEINELPVIAPRSRDVLAEGNVIALEPKFVIPHVGAVGIENTYVIRADGPECLTRSPEEIIPLD